MIYWGILIYHYYTTLGMYPNDGDRGREVPEEGISIPHVEMTNTHEAMKVQRQPPFNQVKLYLH